MSGLFFSWVIGIEKCRLIIIVQMHIEGLERGI